MSEMLLQLEHVSRFYKTIIGVGDLHLQLRKGAYGLIGPNGAGKTTFINLVVGILRPSIGCLKVLGCDPVRHRHVLNRIGLCPASDILYPNISGLQWVEYMTGLHGFSRREARQRAHDSLLSVGMQDNMMRPIGTYSLGMRQRTKLAQAIAHSPELLILDEPFNGLDPIGRHELTEFLKDWIQQGRSLILASHILHEVEAITAGFLLIHGGRILASGDAREVRSMLSGFPVEVELTGNGLQFLAREAIECSWCNGVTISHDKSRLKLNASDHSKLLSFLSAVACREEVCITGLKSPSGSLENAFELLLKAHRGESSPGQHYA
jgi:ABC-2 type transport system ATP-binding protein